MNFGEKLREARAKADLTQGQLAKLINTTSNSVSNWEKGISKPYADMLSLLCGTLDIDANWLLGFEHAEIDLTPAGQRIGYAYEKAPQREQSIVEQVLEPYIDNIEDVIFIKWRISEQAAAAGNGIYLGPETFTEYEVNEAKLPRGAAFGVPISGDSMEPEYSDGEIAIISKVFPEVGQVGLFTYNGNGYIKQLGDGVLESFNPKYDDILITDDVIINGRVIGVITWDDVRK